MLLPSMIQSTGSTLQGYGMPKVSAKLQDLGKRQPVGRIQLRADPTALSNHQPHVHNLLRPDQTMLEDKE